MKAYTVTELVDVPVFRNVPVIVTGLPETGIEGLTVTADSRVNAIKI
jgi:hypothetical protein